MDQAKLLAALRGNEPGAAEELVDACGERLLRSAFLLCGDEAEAQDMVQETFLQAFRSAHRFRGQSAVYTWLHGILLNVSRHYHRARKRLVYEDAVSEEPATDEAPTAQSDASAASNALAVALQKLSTAHREVVLLRYYEGLKVSEIARALGVSEGTVKSRLHYALDELRMFVPTEMNLFGPPGTNETRVHTVEPLKST